MASHPFERAARTMTCREVVACTTAYLEDNVQDAARRSLEPHLSACAGCRAYVDQIASVRDAVRLLPGLVMGSAQRNRLRQAFEARRFD